MTTTIPASTPKRGRGRPPKFDWEAKRTEIELLIRLGYGTPYLAATYGMTQPGMLLVLRRLGLKTDYARAVKHGEGTE